MQYSYKIPKYLAISAKIIILNAIVVFQLFPCMSMPPVTEQMLENLLLHFKLIINRLKNKYHNW